MINLPEEIRVKFVSWLEVSFECCYPMETT